MLRFWQTLLDNLVFLICLMPLVGAVLVACSARLGIEAIRRTAATNAMLTFSLTLLMAANFASQENRPRDSGIQMSTSWPWLQSQEFTLAERTGEDGEAREVLVGHVQGLNVRLALGVDGISLWWMVLTAMLTLPATLAAGRHEWQSTAVHYALLLLLEAGLMVVFAALDVVFYLMALALIAFPFFWLIAKFGRYNRLPAARKFFAVHLTGTLLVTCGLLATVTAHARMSVTATNPHATPTFDTRQLIFGGTLEGETRRVTGLREFVLVQEAALEYWADAGPWIFLALFAGFALHAAIVPWHLWMTHVAGESPTTAGLLLTGIGPAVGAYGMARYVVPLFPAVHLPIVAWIATLGVFGSIFAALVAATQKDLLKLALYLGVSQICLGMAGIFSFNVVGLIGGFLLIASAGLSTAVMMFVAGPNTERAESATFGIAGSMSSRRTRCLLLACLSFIGVPGLGGFVGQFLVLQGLFNGGQFEPGSPLSSIGALVAIGLAAWAIVRFFKLQPRHTHAVSSDDFSIEQFVAVGICLAALFVIGIFPATVTGPMEHSAAEAVAGRQIHSAEEKSEAGSRTTRSKSRARNATNTTTPQAAVSQARPRA